MTTGGQDRTQTYGWTKWWRWLTLWVCPAIAIPLFILTVASVLGSLKVTVTPQLEIYASAGTIGVTGFSDKWQEAGIVDGELIGTRVRQTGVFWRLRKSSWSTLISNWGWVPKYRSVAFTLSPIRSLKSLQIPMSIPLVVCGGLAAWAWRRERRLARIGACKTCGYALAGLPAGTPCPECGKRASA